jgi:streptogramin lyase
MLAQNSRRLCWVLVLAAVLVSTPLVAQDIAKETGGNPADFANAIYPPDVPSNSSCTVLFRVVHAGTMAPITSGYGTGLDLDQNPNANSYSVKQGTQGASFSGGTIRDVTSQFQNGTLRIPNAPEHFHLDVEFGEANGGTGYSALIYRQCFRPETVLYLVISSTEGSPQGDWLWAKRAPIVITEFPLPPTGNAVPVRIAAGPDGAMWFTESNSNKIGRITTAGKITEYPIPTAAATPQGIAAGPDGNVWFIEATGRKVGRITTSGAITEFPIPDPSSQPEEITSGPDGNLWFTDGNNSIGRVTPAGGITEFAMPVADSAPSGITAGPDGNLWICKANIWRGATAAAPVFTAVDSTSNAVQAGELDTPVWITVGPDGALWFTGQNSNTIQRLTTSGGLTLNEHIPTPKSAPFGIAAGKDGALWFTEAGGNNIARITTDGKTINEFPVPTDSATPMGIAAGPDGDLWFVEQSSNKIGRVVLPVPAAQ